MAVHVLARLSRPLTQSLRYSVNANLIAIRPSKLCPLFIDSRSCQTSRDNFICDRSPEQRLSAEKENVTVVFPDGSSELLTLARAERIAVNRNSELIGVQDDADCRVVYRLVPLASGNHSRKSEGEKKERPKKQPKGIDINTATTERDLLVKCKKIVKMVQNHHIVRIRVSNAEQMNKTTGTPEQEIRDILRSTIQELGTIREESSNEKRTILIIDPKPKDVRQD